MTRTPVEARTGWPAALWVLFVLVLVMPPQPVPSESAAIGFWCLACGERGGADTILNLLLFIPGGLLAARAVGPLWGVLGLAAGSVLIEGVQYWIPGRYSTLSDVLFNILGAVVGMLLLRFGASVPARRVGAALAVLAWIAPVILLLPVRPGEPLYGQWRPILGGMERFEGNVLSAEVGGEPVPSWEIEDPRVEEAVAGHAALDILIEAGAAPAGMAPFFAIAEGSGRRVLILAAHGEDLAYYRRGVASILRLEQPWVWVAGSMEGVSEGDTVRYRVVRNGQSLCIAVDESRGCGVAPGLERGWQMLSGSQIPPGLLTALASVVWSLILGALVGQGCASVQRAAIVALALALLGVGLATLSPFVTSDLRWALPLLFGAVCGAAFHKMTESSPRRFVRSDPRGS